MSIIHTERESTSFDDFILLDIPLKHTPRINILVIMSMTNTKEGKDNGRILR